MCQDCSMQEQKCSIYLELADSAVLWFVWFESAHRLPANAMFMGKFALYKNLHSLRPTYNVVDDDSREIQKFIY